MPHNFPFQFVRPSVGSLSPRDHRILFLLLNPFIYSLRQFTMPIFNSAHYGLHSTSCGCSESTSTVSIVLPNKLGPDSILPGKGANLHQSATTTKLTLKGLIRPPAADVSPSKVTYWDRISPKLVLKNHGSVARDHLASERTFLAYVRTSIAIASVGIGMPFSSGAERMNLCLLEISPSTVA
jgi:hypothetical protein